MATRYSMRRLSSDDEGRVVEILCDSFYDYPVMRQVLADAGSDYDARLRVLVAFFCDRRLGDAGWVLGCEVDGVLAGVSVFDEPEVPASEAGSGGESRVEVLTQAIGAQAVERLRAYDRVGDSLLPEGAYHYLGMLGVSRRFQGAGVGGRLIAATQEVATASEVSTGVCLHTEAEENVPLYRHLGYEVIGEADALALHTWCMFRRT